MYYLKDLNKVTRQRYKEKVILAGFRMDPYCLENKKSRNIARYCDIICTDVGIVSIIHGNHSKSTLNRSSEQQIQLSELARCTSY